MGGFIVILAGLLLAGTIWLLFRLQVWVIKTAIKEALREYDREKLNGPKEY